VSETPSFSIFTIEADRKPLLAFGAKKYQEAEAFCADERVRTKLRSVRSGGIPLCNDDSILRVRLATSEERVRYHDRMKQRSSMENLAAVFLVDVDKAQPPGAETAHVRRERTPRLAELNREPPVRTGGCLKSGL
jgi:hypothetical protein